MSEALANLYCSRAQQSPEAKFWALLCAMHGKEQVLRPELFEAIVTRGFESGNYAAAYETEDFEKAVEALDNPIEHFLPAFTLGFFSTYELSEMGAHAEAYREALASEAGKKCLELGYCDELELEE